MGKTSLFLVGILVFLAAAGGMWYRIAEDPDAMKRYNWALEQIGVRKEQAAPTSTEEAGAQTREVSPDATRAERSAARRERRHDRDQLELFKLGLDFANLLIGLIGIYLAVRGMRPGRNSQSQG